MISFFSIYKSSKIKDEEVDSQDKGNNNKGMLLNKVILTKLGRYEILN